MGNDRMSTQLTPNTFALDSLTLMNMKNERYVHLCGEFFLTKTNISLHINELSITLLEIRGDESIWQVQYSLLGAEHEENVSIPIRFFTDKDYRFAMLYVLQNR